jgi:transposase
MQTPTSLSHLSHAEKDALILMLQEQIKALQEAVKQLQSRGGGNMIVATPASHRQATD